MKKGLLIVHTGDGKGKTTAALGLVLRTAGHGLRVCVIQFIKGSWKYGELESMKRFQDLVDFHVMGKGFTWKSENIGEDRKLAQQAWEFAEQIIQSGKYQMVVLDELTWPINYSFLDEKRVVETLRQKDDNLHVVITGRNCPDSLLEAADLVTEMTEIRHPYKNGVKAQKGIEF